MIDYDLPRFGALFRYFFSGAFIARESNKFILPEGNMRVKITLSCTACKQRNYNTFKNKKNDPDRIEFSKYCRFCRKHTAHKETK